MRQKSVSRAAIVAAMSIMLILGFAAQRLVQRTSTAAGARQAMTVIEPAQPLAEFALRDDRGDVFDRDRLRGRWTFLFFGYTQCPDVCPAAMMTFKQVRAQAGGRERNVQYVLVSVDPERDSGARLGEYVRYFDPEFIGATGSHAELAQLTKPMGVYYARSGAGKDYQVNHSSAIFLIDPEVRFRALLAQPHVPGAIAAGLETLRKQ